MPRYDYRCRIHGVVEITHAMADVAAPQRCPRYFGNEVRERCSVVMKRVFVDAPSFICDPVRRSYLKAKGSSTLADQERDLDPMTPHDAIDKRRLERDLGRIYVGDDTSGMTPKAQRAVDRYKQRDIPRTKPMRTG
jgi:hypothetical protein